MKKQTNEKTKVELKQIKFMNCTLFVNESKPGKFEKDLKIKYGAKIDTTNKKWQAMTPQEKAAAANKGYKIN